MMENTETPPRVGGERRGCGGRKGGSLWGTAGAKKTGGDYRGQSEGLGTVRKEYLEGGKLERGESVSVE